MGKTRRSDEESKQEQILELKGRLKLQKKEISRLNRRVKSLEKGIEEKKPKIKQKKLSEKEALIEQLRKDFMKCKI